MTEKVRLSQCGFCGVSLNSKNRAKEHVLRRSWLAHLGHSKLPLPVSLYSKDGLIATRNSTADNHLAGEVCRGCNNGWMNHLDRQVEPLLMPLIMDYHASANLTPLELRRIARWLLKTATAHELADKPERRSLPTSARRNLRRANWLPTGLWIFACQSSTPVKGIDISILDVWPWYCSETLKNMPQSQRMKFGIGYDNLFIGFGLYLGKGRPTFLGVQGIHIPLLTVGADFMLDGDPKAFEVADSLWHHPEYGGSQTYVALGSIGIRIDAHPQSE